MTNDIYPEIVSTNQVTGYVNEAVKYVISDVLLPAYNNKRTNNLLIT